MATQNTGGNLGTPVVEIQAWALVELMREHRRFLGLEGAYAPHYAVASGALRKIGLDANGLPTEACR